MKNELEQLQKGLDALKQKYEDSIKPKIEIGKWHIFTNNKEDSREIIYVTHIDGYKVYFYGIDSNGNWRDKGWYNIVWNYRLATPQEVQEALTKEAVKRGFKEGALFKPIASYCNVRIVKQNEFYFDTYGKFSVGCGVVLSSNGTWAEIISEPKTIETIGEDLKYGTSAFIKNYLTENKSEIIETLKNL